MSGRIPQHFIDELLNRVDIVEVIDSRVPLKKAGREYQACCPFHNEKTPSFTVSPTKQFYHCFGCGAHGSAIGFLMEYEHMDFVEAVEELARAAGVEVPREQGAAPPPRDDTQALVELSERAAEYYQRQLREHPQAQRAVDYLRGRGLTGQIAAEFELGYAPPGWSHLEAALGGTPQVRKQLETLGLTLKRDDGGAYDRFRDRIMFPIRDRRGRVIGFGGRVLGDEKPKYLNSPETPLFHKGRELYGLYEARKRQRSLERLLVVEGYMDVVALSQFGIGYAVATLGTATTQEHLERLYRVVPEVVFCFDGDRAGRQAAWRALENALPVLREGRQARFLFLPEGEDPDSLVRKEGKEGFEARIADSIPFSEFFFEGLSRRVDMGSMDGRARLVELARPFLSKLPEGVFRKMMVQRLSEIAQLDVSRLPELGAAGGPAPPPKPPRGREPGVTPVRWAITLLVHRPDIAQEVATPSWLAESDLPGATLLMELLDFCRARPHLTTGGVLEHWRDSEHAPHLAKLARKRLDVPETGMNVEFRDSLQRLRQQQREARTERLLQESRARPLSDAEKMELRQLLATGNQDD
jgi:DNA primase